MSQKSKINFTSLIVLIVFIILASWFFYSQGILFDVNSMIEFTESFGALSYFIFFMVVVLEAVAAPIPGFIIYTAGGILFGGFIGGTLALVANAVGAAIAFYIGKYIILEKPKKEEKKKFDKAIEKYGGWAIFFLRFNPLTSSDIFSYLAGISKMKFPRFIIGTTLGLLPFTYVQSYFGQEILLQNELLFNLFVFASIAYIVIFIYILLNKDFRDWIKDFF